MPNKPVVATADNDPRSLRSGRSASAVPYLRHSLNKNIDASGASHSLDNIKNYLHGCLVISALDHFRSKGFSQIIQEGMVFLV